MLGIGAGFVLVWGWYLDRVVTTRMEGQRFALTSRVFARPLELYPGIGIDAHRLEFELDAAGYLQRRGTPAPGTFQRDGDTFLIRSAAFTFPDGREPTRSIRARLGNHRVEALTGEDGRPLAVQRLDPALIGRIYPLAGEDRRFVPLERVPPLLVDTLLAVEDRDFYEHHGLDFGAIARAAWVDLKSMHLAQGGSTITQQLAKNLFLSRARNLPRKLNEAAMALLLEWHYGKRDILEAYLNEIYLGQEGSHAIHGIGRGAEHWFNARPENLDAAQIALLVGMIRAPSLYDPRRHPDAARRRRARVLDIMAERGLIGSGEARRLAGAGLGVTAEPPGPAGRYPAFLDLVRRELATDYRDRDLRADGLNIFTTLDPWAQHAAESAIAAALPGVERRTGQAGGSLQTAAVLTAANTGEVLALVGDRRARAGGFNRALESRRPVGSLLKPAIYLRALAEPSRYTLASTLEDTPVRVTLDDGSIWAPENFDREYHGRVPLIDALAFSYNAATVRLGMDLGVARLADTLRALGVRRELEAYPSLLLGAAGFNVLEMAQVYQALATGGYPTPVRAVQAVTSADGERVRRYPLKLDRVRWPRAAYLVTRALQYAVREGTGRGLGRYLPSRLGVAGKTGTSDGERDAWFAGYTGDRLAVVWVGRDDNRPANITGASAALPVFGELIRRVPVRPLDPAPPEGVSSEWVLLDGPLLADEGCANAVRIPFVEGSAPDRVAPCAHRRDRGLSDWVKGLFGH